LPAASNRLTQQALGTMTRPAVMSMDAWRDSVEVPVTATRLTCGPVDPSIRIKP
jgi:hypothetical protein